MILIRKKKDTQHLLLWKSSKSVFFLSKKKSQSNFFTGCISFILPWKNVVGFDEIQVLFYAPYGHRTIETDKKMNICWIDLKNKIMKSLHMFFFIYQIPSQNDVWFFLA